MLITVNRFTSDDDATLSMISVDGKFVCFGLEDEYRPEKVANETRIPAGTYNITLRTVGGFHERYSQRFDGIHKGMLWVRDVPGFEYILIHCGNTDQDTAGCLLVGAQAHARDMTLGSSSLAYQDLYRAVVDAAALGDLSIEYVDNDR
jgi:hypothetical protein